MEKKGHLLDRRNRAGAVLELELNVLVVELAAEAPGKLRGVLSQQSLPPLLLSRQSQTEQAIASFLLGGEAVGPCRPAAGGRGPPPPCRAGSGRQRR